MQSGADWRPAVTLHQYGKRRRRDAVILTATPNLVRVRDGRDADGAFQWSCRLKLTPRGKTQLPGCSATSPSAILRSRNGREKSIVLVSTVTWASRNGIGVARGELELCAQLMVATWAPPWRDWAPHPGARSICWERCRLATAARPDGSAPACLLPRDVVPRARHRRHNALLDDPETISMGGANGSCAL